MIVDIYSDRKLKTRVGRIFFNDDKSIKSIEFCAPISLDEFESTQFKHLGYDVIKAAYMSEPEDDYYD
jgi:hypothetical protein